MGILFNGYTKNNMSTQSIEFEFKSGCQLNVGDYLYGITNSESFYATEPCTICDGTGKVFIKNQEFECPNCKTQTRHNQNPTDVRIHNYVVCKFKIYKFEYKIDDDVYEPKRQTNRILFYAFTKHNDSNFGCGNTMIASFRPEDVFAEKFKSYDDLHKFLKENHNIDIEKDPNHSLYNNVLFKDYKTAIAIANRFNTIEQNKLNEFNTIHKTSHATSFKRTHDKPFTKDK